MLCTLLNIEKMDAKTWSVSLDKAMLCRITSVNMYDSRRKDYDNHFMQVTF
jgi:hypothetical protein